MHNTTTNVLFRLVRFSQKRQYSQATAVDWPRSTTLLSILWPPFKPSFSSFVRHFPFFPSIFQPCPSTKFPRTGSWARFSLVSTSPSRLFGRAASFDWILVRARRLVTGYPQRGHAAWALWSRGEQCLCGDSAVLCGLECEPQSLLTPSSLRTWFYSRSWFPIFCSVTF